MALRVYKTPLVHYSYWETGSERDVTNPLSMSKCRNMEQARSWAHLLLMLNPRWKSVSYMRSVNGRKIYTEERRHENPVHVSG